MDKKAIFGETKVEIAKLVEHWDLEHFEEGLNGVQKYLNFMCALNELENLPKQETSKVANENEEVEETDSSAGAPLPPTKYEQTKASGNKNKGYLFERKLKGGYIEAIDAYVPETIIRKLGLQHGDRVTATRKTEPQTSKTSFARHTSPFGKFKRLVKKEPPHYHFELVKKGQTHEIDRAELKYCVVEKDGSIWVCNKTLSGESIRLDDMPFTVLIKSDEVTEYNLTEGDIIDIAYVKSNPTKSKVIWKHITDGDEYITPLPSSAYKEKEKVATPSVTEHPDLKNITVAIIGCIERFSVFRDRLTALGAIYEGMDGNEDEDRISATIKRSDIVLIIIPAISHHGSSAAKKFCKLHGTPFATVDTIGTSSVIAAAIQLSQNNRVEIS